MNKKYFHLLIISLLLVSNLALLYFLIQKPKNSFHQNRPKNIITEKLQFDDQQIVSYQKLIDQHRKDIRENDIKILTIKNELYSYLNNKGSASTIDSLISEIGLTQKQIEEIHFNHFLDIKALCKPEQLSNFYSLTEELTEIINQNRHLKHQPK